MTDDLFGDENVLGVAAAGEHRVLFVTAPASALNGEVMEAFPTFDPDVIVVAVSENALSLEQTSPEDARDAVMGIFDKGLALALDILER
jgi:hypothetical protein